MSVILMVNLCGEYSLEVSVGVPIALDNVLMRDPGQMNEPPVIFGKWICSVLVVV